MILKNHCINMNYLYFHPSMIIQISIISLFYRPQRSWGKVMFLQVSVILLTEGVPGPWGGLLREGGGSAPGGGCLVETPLGRPLLRAVRILLECILVDSLIVITYWLTKLYRSFEIFFIRSFTLCRLRDSVCFM